jgi:hypothetical protein
VSEAGSGRLVAGVGVAERPERGAGGCCVAGGERLSRRWVGRLFCLGEQLLLRRSSLEVECGLSPKRACMEEGRVEVGGGREPVEDVDRAPVLMTSPSGMSPKGMVRRAVGGEMGVAAAVLPGGGLAVVLWGDVWCAVGGLSEAVAGAGRRGGCSGLEEPGSS